MAVDLSIPLTPIRVWLRWIVANAWSELIGLGSVGGLGYLVATQIGEPSGIASAMVVAMVFISLGTVEGLVVGFAQDRVLRDALPQVSGWIRATVSGAAASWAMGIIPSTVMSLIPHEPGAAPPQISEVLRLELASGLGLVTGPMLALFQWRRLRRHVPRAWVWLPANALAWAAGMPVVFYAVHIAAGSATSWQAAAILAVFLLLTGALVGIIHGGFLAWLIVEKEGNDVTPADRRWRSH